MTFLLCRHCSKKIEGDRIIRTKTNGGTELHFSYHFDCFFDLQLEIKNAKNSPNFDQDLEVHGD